MPTAFDRTTPKSEHNPLANQMEFDPSKPTLDVGTILDAWLSTFDEFIIPIILDLTGLDLSSPEAFFSSIALMVINGGTAVTEFVRSILQPLVDAIVAFLGPIPIIGDVVENLANFLGLTHNTANNAQVTGEVAQASANTANVGIAILNARVNGIIIGGASLYDTFDRNVTDMATDPAYDVEYFNGPGTMNLSTADSGVARWNPVGYSDAAFIARDITTPMTTNIVRVSAVISDFTYGYAGNQAHIRLMGRMDAARQNYVVGTVEDGLAEIGYVIAGTYTRIGGQVSVTTDTGDLWDLEVGTLGDEWQFRLLQNNAERVNRNDLGHASMKDTLPGAQLYNFVAIGGDCAIGAGPFGTTYQIGMPDFQVLAAADF
jgi:hypothetical protein